MDMEDGDDDYLDTRDFFLGSSSIGTAETASDVSEDASDLLHDGAQHCDEIFDEQVAQSDLDLSNFVALGAIRIRLLEFDRLSEVRCWMEDAKGSLQRWPNPSMTLLLNKGVMKSRRIDHSSDPKIQIHRIYVLAEDADCQYPHGSLLEFRRAIKSLIPFIDIARETWDSNFDPLTPIRTYQDPVQDHESLFYIFNTLASPSFETGQYRGSEGRLASRISAEEAVMSPQKSGSERLNESSPGTISDPSNHSFTMDDIPGLKTELYPYQFRSVATMLQRESDPVKCIDPRKPQYPDSMGQSFYFDIHEGILLRRPHLYEECRGGVLAETMGYGKTLICLAVILATRGHYPSIPEGRVEIAAEPRPRVGSLLGIAAAAAVRKGVPWKAEFHAFSKEGYHYDKCIGELRKYSREYLDPIYNPSNPKRKGKREPQRVVRLCSTTLVVVPPNLLVQWQHEIEAHMESDALDVLSIDQSTKIIPEFTELIKYDIVLITKARLEQEYRDDDLNNGKIRRGEEALQSPLTRVRWLRIICDEGHGFAGSASRTNALAMIDKLSIERRWVVSGTPSSSMLGVEVELAADVESFQTTPDHETSDAENHHRRNSIRSTLQSRKTSDSSEGEVKDMEKLKLLVVNCLKVKPWSNLKGLDHANWKKYFAPFDSNGKRRRVASLRTLLQSLIVRHRIEDIDADLCLPPLHNRTVMLEPSYYDKLSMNLFVLVLTSNAITSERTDEDYMFHPKNRKQLEVLINNLRQSSFHWVGFREEDVTGAMRNSETYLDKHLDDVQDRDGALLTQAIVAGQRALDDVGWRAFSVLQEIGVYIEDFPDHAWEAWSIHGQPTKPLLLGTVQARAAQKHIWTRFTDEDPTASLAGAGLRIMQLAHTKAAEDSQSRAKASSQASEEPKLKTATSLSTTRPGGLPMESPKRKRVEGYKSRNLPNDRIDFNEFQPASGTSSAHAVLRKTRIVGFTSAKLTYLIDQVMVYQNSEKIIIFYDANNIAFWIAEALELLGVKFLIYANTLTTARRATYLATFNQKEDFRVLLMDLKQAAHGLHVACASRVYIVNPIWQPNIESQAIKRAHRIGQKKPVHVETLVLRGTMEERMLQRRKEMSNTELQKAKTLLDDRTMAEVIKNERFFKFRPSDGVATIDAESGRVRWNTTEDAKVVRLAAPQPLFGLQKTEQSPEEGLVMTAGDVTRRKGGLASSRSRMGTPMALSAEEVPAQKKLKLAVRILE